MHNMKRVKQKYPLRAPFNLSTVFKIKTKKQAAMRFKNKKKKKKGS